MQFVQFNKESTTSNLILFAAGFSAGAFAMAICKYLFQEAEYSVPAGVSDDFAYKKELKVALECAIVAGNNIVDALTKEKQVTEKGLTDFVTETDKANEIYIFQSLRNQFPDHRFIGEETSSEAGGVAPLTDSPTWIVDPVDGTTNFVHANPNTCVSIGLTVNKKTVMGVVYAPMFKEMYIVAKGYGAFMNGKKIQVSSVKKIKEAIISTEFGYVRSVKGVATMTSCLEAVLNRQPHAIRQMGSGVLNLCYVASGRLDAVYAGVAGESWKPWDHCAGSLMVEEAGGAMLKVNGDPFDIYGDSVLAASSRSLCNEIVAAVRSVTG